jgi:hypothetical protein
LRHCAISRKVAGSIPDGVVDVILRSNQLLTEMSIGNIFWGVKAADA